MALKSDTITVYKAFEWLNRFMNHPCLKLASLIKQHMPQISEMVQKYQYMLQHQKFDPYTERLIQSFIQEFEKARLVIDYYEKLAIINPEFNLEQRSREMNISC